MANKNFNVSTKSPIQLPRERPPPEGPGHSRR